MLLLTLIIAALALVHLLMYLAVSKAPYGYEDSKGFHYSDGVTEGNKAVEEDALELLEAQWLNAAAEQEWASTHKEEAHEVKLSKCS